MADEIAVKFTNLPDFSAKLKALGFDIEKNIVRSGVNAALQVFKKAVVAATPVHKGRYPNSQRQKVPGTLKRAVYVARSKRSSTPGVEAGILRPRTGNKAVARLADAYYWRWVEKGHLIRKRGQALRGGTRSKKLQRDRLNKGGAAFVPGVFFIRDSFNAKEGEAVAAFSKRVETRIEKANRAH